MDGIRSELVGAWVHAHERDHDGEQIFVPASTPMPRARGRDALTLAADGGAGRTGPGADDRTIGADGRWEVDGDRLAVYLRGSSTLLYYIRSATPAELVLMPVTPFD